MFIVLLFSSTCLASYVLGYIIGKCTAENEIQEQRKEMQIDEDKEVDPLDELFK
jgi:hypothetical protein